MTRAKDQSQYILAKINIPKYRIVNLSLGFSMINPSQIPFSI